MNNTNSIRDLLMNLSSKENIPVLKCYDGMNLRTILAKDFINEVLTVSGYFKQHNLSNKHIAILGHNSYDWILVFFAIISSGNIPILMNPNLPADILCTQLKQADVDLVCGSPDVISPLQHIDTQLRWLQYKELKECKALDLQDISVASGNSTALMLFTSGTTGISKIVTISVQNLLTSAKNFKVSHPPRSSNVPKSLFLSLPFFHIGTIRTLTNALISGIQICIGHGIQYTFVDMAVLTPVYVGMVPAMAETLAKQLRRIPVERRARYFGSNFSTIYAVGSAMRYSVAQELLQQGIQIEIIYGMTESTGDGTWCELDEAHIGTIGKPDGNVQLKIQDGEILIKSEGVMKGYYKDPEETAKVIVDGWLHTGDMGYCDEDGYYYITGRKKNVIILSNGENVNPEEIEATFGECSAIDECLVYSDGKGICADVFANDQATAAAFIKQYNESMPMYRQVYKVNYTEEPLPKTGSGKIQRKQNL